MAQAEYVFHGAGDQRELERLTLIERVFDPATQRRLLATGVQAGWRGLEVVLGAESIMRWLGETVGLTGQIVAVDLNPKFLSQAGRPNVKVMRADIRTVSLPPQSFDLVHARYVLIHLSDSEVALTAMLECLKPGDGWFLRNRISRRPGE